MSYEFVDDDGRVVTLQRRVACEWCNEWIEKGEKAVVRVYKWDNVFHSYRQHLECYKAMKDTPTFESRFEFVPGDQGRGCFAGEIADGK